MAKTVYFLATGATFAVASLIDDIDAHDAVRRFPGEYSFTPPDGVEIRTARTVHSAMAAGEPLPMTGADQGGEEAPKAAKGK